MFCVWSGWKLPGIKPVWMGEINSFSIKNLIISSNRTLSSTFLRTESSETGASVIKQPLLSVFIVMYRDYINISF